MLFAFIMFIIIIFGLLLGICIVGAILAWMDDAYDDDYDY